MKQKLKLFAIFALLVFAFMACELDPGFKEMEAVQDTVLRAEAEQGHVVGGYWITPKHKTKNVGDEIKTKLRVNCGDYLIGAISIQISYNPQIITPNPAIGDKGLTTDVFLLPSGGFAVNILPISATESQLFIGAFHASGVDPDPAAVLFDINWIGVAPGETDLIPNVLMSVDARDYSTVGLPIGYPSSIRIH